MERVFANFQEARQVSMGFEPTIPEADYTAGQIGGVI